MAPNQSPKLLGGVAAADDDAPVCCGAGPPRGIYIFIHIHRHTCTYVFIDLFLFIYTYTCIYCLFRYINVKKHKYQKHKQTDTCIFKYA